ncbi:B-cell receptor CD22-like protein [Lates japonicus]|uniref:B-cell receptor CD22-like protein n=1 Tax=Lates japonicus TaxID=270547 RepID=A0AAD3NAL4_LATJO|nr:B-cell receptor CD22-like protein [Lates japonicus]
MKEEKPLNVLLNSFLPSILSVFIDIFPRSHVQFESSAVILRAPPISPPIGHEDYCSPPVYPPKLPSVSNERGRHNSTLYLTVGTSSPLLGNSAVMTNIIRLTLVVLMLIPLLLLILWTRRKKTPLSSTTEPNDYEETVEMDSPPVYENVSDLKAVTAAQTPRAAGRC